MVKVSIIIPLHNSEAFIKETIQSCLNQSYQNIEVIVVENGSTDNSFGIVQSLNDKRLQLFKIETPNAAAARNYGLNKAAGDYIMFLDADDILASNKIELQLNALTQKPDGFVASCAWVKFDHDIKYSRLEIQPVWTIENPVDWCVQSWTGGGMMIPGCWLIPRTVIDEAGHWDENLSLHDDGEFMCRVLLASKGNCFVEHTKVYYRQVSNSLSKQNKSLKAAKSALAVYRSYEKNLLKHKDDNESRFALAYNYCQLLYEFYPRHKAELEQARKYLKNLNVNPLPKVGSSTFKKLVNRLGFNNALIIIGIKRLFN